MFEFTEDDRHFVVQYTVQYDRDYRGPVVDVVIKEVLEYLENGDLRDVTSEFRDSDRLIERITEYHFEKGPKEYDSEED